MFYICPWHLLNETISASMGDLYDEVVMVDCSSVNRNIQFAFNYKGMILMYATKLFVLHCLGCAGNPCRNNGQCVVGIYDEYTCMCPPGYSGKQCEQG